MTYEVESIHVTPTQYFTRCGVCNSTFPISDTKNVFRLCPECIKAIKWARLQMKSCDMSMLEDDEK